MSAVPAPRALVPILAAAAFLLQASCGVWKCRDCEDPEPAASYRAISDAELDLVLRNHQTWLQDPNRRADDPKLG